MSKEEIELLREAICDEEKTSLETPVVLKGQYKRAIELLTDAEMAGLPVAIVGPPGVGKTLIARYFASQLGRPFYWITLDESTKPVHLIGGMDPAIVLKRGYILDAFMPGPMLRAMIKGGIFLANEINRATEYTQNVFLEPLEEGSIYVPKIGRVKARDGFFFIAAMNPSELVGTHRLSEALRDRIKVWITLDYPSRSTEMEIIRRHCPELTDESALDRIMSILELTRKNDEIDLPASIRTGIAMAKMWAVMCKRGKKTIKDFQEMAISVLQGAIKSKTGISTDQLARQLVIEALKGE